MKNDIGTLVQKVMAEKIPEFARQSAEYVMVDTLIAILYGLKTEEELKLMLNDKGVGDGVNIPGTDKKLSKTDALLTLGTAVVANELDEGNTFAKGHPSAHILPVIYICALEQEYTLQEILDAYIRAYEISSRLSYAFQMKDNMHPHGTWGNAGGASARAILEGKNTDEITDIILLSLSLPMATSWQAAERGQSVRNLYTGYGNVLAYEAVDLARYGFISDLTVVGNLWGDIMGEKIESEKLFEEFFDPPMITQNYFKVYPTCRFTHAAIEAAEQISAKPDLDPSDIEKITINTYNLAARCDTKIISTRLESKFSIPYAVSCIFLGLNLYDDYTDNISSIRGFIDKIEVIDDEKITSLLPSKRAAECIVRDNTGKEHSYFISNAKGEYSYKFTGSEFKEKYKNMLQDHYEFYSDEWLNQLLNIDRVGTFSKWLHFNHLIKEDLTIHES